MIPTEEARKDWKEGKGDSNNKEIRACLRLKFSNERKTGFFLYKYEHSHYEKVLMCV